MRDFYKTKSKEWEDKYMLVRDNETKVKEEISILQKKLDIMQSCCAKHEKRSAELTTKVQVYEANEEREQQKVAKKEALAEQQAITDAAFSRLKSEMITYHEEREKKQRI